MKRELRLTRSTDFKRVRLHGKSYAHPLVVLKILPNDSDRLHIGFAVGKNVGNAVTRNRIKRRLRAVLHQYTPMLLRGKDLVFIARTPMASAAYQDIERAILNLVERAQLLNAQEQLEDDRVRIPE